MPTAAGDYATAYRIERTDYERQFQLGTVIAAGIVGGRAEDLPASFDSPLTRLRSALGELLGEHMQLVVDAMGAALRGGPEFKADAAQVNADTAQLAGAFGVLFGPQSGAQFESVWSDHIEALISYSAAVAAKDQQGKAKAIAKYHAFERHLSTFLSTSTDGRLKAPALAMVLRMHDSELVQQLDAYARGDYTTEYRVIYDGYQHMFMVAQVLSAAIGPTIAARLPKGGVTDRRWGDGALTMKPLAGRGARRRGVGGAAGVGVLAGRGAAQRQHHLLVAGPRRRRSRASRPAWRGFTPFARTISRPFRCGCGYPRSPCPRLWCGSAGFPTEACRSRSDWDKAGWYDQGPRPGQPGPAVILGHVDSKTGPAVFYQLRDAAAGRHRPGGPGGRPDTCLPRAANRTVPEG